MSGGATVRAVSGASPWLVTLRDAVRLSLPPSDGLNRGSPNPVIGFTA